MASAINLAGPLLRPRRTDDWRPGLVMALAAHGLLLLALVFSVNWRTTQRETVEAEMWSEIPTAATRTALPQEAAPEPAPTPRPVEPPPPPPAPAPAPPPEPVPAEIQTRKEPPKPVKTKPPKEVFDSTPPKPAKKPEPRPKPEPAPKPAPAPSPKPEPVPKPAPAKAPVAAPTPPGPTTAERERARKAAIERMMADLGGSALSSAGPKGSDYGGRIRSLVLSHIRFQPDSVAGNPMAIVEVRCTADGRVLASTITKSSGAPEWDEAVLRAIDAIPRFPTNEQGRVPSPLVLELRPKDI